MENQKKNKFLLKKILNKLFFNLRFVLYRNNIDGIKEYQKINGKYIKLEKPIKVKMFGVYKDSFGCSFTNAIKNFSCLKQILSFNRFYNSIGIDKSYLKTGTKFNIFLLPIVYLYCLIDTKKFYSIAFIKKI